MHLVRQHRLVALAIEPLSQGWPALGLACRGLGGGLRQREHGVEWAQGAALGLGCSGARLHVFLAATASSSCPQCHVQAHGLWWMARSSLTRPCLPKCTPGCATSSQRHPSAAPEPLQEQRGVLRRVICGGPCYIRECENSYECRNGKRPQEQRQEG